MPIELLIFGTYAALVLTQAIVVFVIAQLKRDNSVMDIAYGPIYAIASWGTLFITELYTYASVLIVCLVTIWAVRLSLRILRKNWGTPEDARYAAWREEWMQRGYLYFFLRSLLQVNLLQGLIILFVSVPIILTIAANEPFLVWSVWLGTTIFFIGLTIETTADWQLDAFIARKKAGTEAATLMKQGLFRYSRRPNYFGESLIWWGLAIFAVFSPVWYLSFLSPLLITYILTTVTGPMLERNFLKKYPTEYTQYMAETNYFIPGPVKSSTE